ncbi:hypothetical protein EYF80_007396 [Liparis tanakae]|uniref:Uncharacterized protein n=1 Tax=Liparis tanakae TaxID=230148 RepID=A0A4Z2IWM2_9TELE|nr:hypothetical protein EYF80_007396 [Liparis tanakae]
MVISILAAKSHDTGLPSDLQSPGPEDTGCPSLSLRLQPLLGIWGHRLPLCCPTGRISSNIRHPCAKSKYCRLDGSTHRRISNKSINKQALPKSPHGCTEHRAVDPRADGG